MAAAVTGRASDSRRSRLMTDEWAATGALGMDGRAVCSLTLRPHIAGAQCRAIEGFQWDNVSVMSLPQLYSA